MLYIILARFPKLLLIITKRYSSVALHFLRHLFPFWSASVQKRKQNHRFLRDLGDVATSTAPSLDGEKGRVAGEDTSVESVTVLSLAGHTAAGRGLTPMPQSSSEVDGCSVCWGFVCKSSKSKRSLLPTRVNTFATHALLQPSCQTHVVLVATTRRTCYATVP